MAWEDYIPEEIKQLYEIRDYRHASAILATEFQNEFQEICQSLKTIRLTDLQVRRGGGNESQLPKTFNKILRTLGWEESRMNARLVVDDKVVGSDTHKIEFVKNRVALDFGIKTKGRHLLKTLQALFAFYEFGRISLGVFIGTNESLKPYLPWFERRIKGKDWEQLECETQVVTGLRNFHALGSSCPVLLFHFLQNPQSGIRAKDLGQSNLIKTGNALFYHTHRSDTSQAASAQVRSPYRLSPMGLWKSSNALVL